METIDGLGLSLRKGIKSEIEGVPGELGRLESTGSLTVPVAGSVNEVYVRLYGDSNNTVTAIDLISSRKPRLPVRVRENNSKRFEVIGVDPLPANEFLGEAAPAETYRPLSVVRSMLCGKAGSSSPVASVALNGSDLQVYMEELPYNDDMLGAVSGDLTATVATIASGKKAWVIISVDPDTNVLAFTKGTDIGIPVPLTKAAGATISVPSGNIKLWGYILRAGATYLPVIPQAPDTLYFADYRNTATPEVLPGGGSTTFSDDELREMIWIGTV